MATITLRKKWGKLWIPVLVVMMLVNEGKSDIAKDKAECANQLTGLAICLPYVSGQSKAPTPDCCTGLKQVLKDTKKCLCLLIKDRNDPSLGLKINSTLALALPLTCHAPPNDANVSVCPGLLHLPPNSPDAKIFTDFGNATAPVSSTSSPATPTTGGSGTISKETSDAWKGNSCSLLVAHFIYGVLFWSFASLAIF